MEYGFTEEQNQLLEEMLKPEYRDLFQSLIGSGPGLTLTDQEIQEILSDLPGALNEDRRQVVLTAYQLLGKVHYFWGGKSLVLGWDSRWGTPKQVWAQAAPAPEQYALMAWTVPDLLIGYFIMSQAGPTS